MGVNTAAFKSKGFRNSRGEKRSGGSNRFVRYIDLKKLEEDTGITKLKIEADGEYNLDFLPFPITQQHPYYKEIKEEFASLGDDNPMDFLITIFVHEVKTDKFTNKFICPQATYGKNCPFCDEYWRIYNGNKDAGMDNKAAYHNSKDKLVPLKHKGRNIALVYNRDDGKVYYFDYSDYYFGKKLEKKMSRVSGDEPIFILPDVSKNGRTVHFFVDPSEMVDKNNNPVPGQIDEMEFLKRDSAVPEEAYADLPALDSYLTIYDEDTIESFLDGTYFLPTDDDSDDDGEEEEEHTPDPTPSREERRARRSQPVVEEDDDLTEDNNPLDGNYADEDDKSAHSVEDEVDPREERRRRRRERQQAKQEDPSCPAGGKFGEDTDTFDECDDCPIYDACDERYEATH